MQAPNNWFYKIYILPMKDFLKQIVHSFLLFCIHRFLEKKYQVWKREFVIYDQQYCLNTSYQFVFVNSIVQANVSVIVRPNHIFPQVVVNWDLFVSEAERMKRFNDFLSQCDEMDKDKIREKLVNVPGLWYYMKNKSLQYMIDDITNSKFHLHSSERDMYSNFAKFMNILLVLSSINREIFEKFMLILCTDKFRIFINIKIKDSLYKEVKNNSEFDIFFEKLHVVFDRIQNAGYRFKSFRSFISYLGVFIIYHKRKLESGNKTEREIEFAYFIKTLKKIVPDMPYFINMLCDPYFNMYLNKKNYEYTRALIDQSCFFDFECVLYELGEVVGIDLVKEVVYHPLFFHLLYKHNSHYRILSVNKIHFPNLYL